MSWYALGGGRGSIECSLRESDSWPVADDSLAGCRKSDSTQYQISPLPTFASAPLHVSSFLHMSLTDTVFHRSPGMSHRVRRALP